MTMGEAQRIRANSVLPARREALTLHTADGLELVGELALPADGDPVATMVCLHPLPTHGGMMDSQIFRKAAAPASRRWPRSPYSASTRAGRPACKARARGASTTALGERYDVAAAIEYAEFAELPNIWVVGWSFGTDLALMYAQRPRGRGAVLLSPPLRFAQPTSTSPRGASPASRWWRSSPSSTTTSAQPRPSERFAAIPQAEVIGVPGREAPVGRSGRDRCST